VSVEQGIVNITGGYSTRGESAQSIQYQVGDATHCFVSLEKNAWWFVKGVGGSKAQKGDLKPVHVVQLLRDMFLKKQGEDPDAETAVAEGQLSAVAGWQGDDGEPEVDPMDAMDDLVHLVPQAKRNSPNKKRKAQYPNRSVVEELEVPTRPPCAGCDKDDKTVVWVYRKPKSVCTGNGGFYLRVDGIEWLLGYAADELHFQGVTPARPDPIARQAGNCPAVADLCLEWDFGEKAWEAKFVAGALVGTTKRMCVNELDRNVWKQMKVSGLFCRATPLEKKNAVKAFMTMWCAAIAGNKAAEFEATMRSPATSSPPEDTAVADAGARLLFPVDDTAVAAEEACLAAACA
jgi:hypothetical protein